MSSRHNTQRIFEVNTPRIASAVICYGMMNRRDSKAQRLREARKAAGYKSAAAAAMAFGWSQPTLTSHENGTREFDTEAAIRYSKALKVPAGYLLALDQAVSQIEERPIPWLGKVAQGVWMEQSPSTDDYSFVTYDKMPGDEDGDDLFAVTPEGDSMNLTIPANAKLICRRIPFGSANAKDGDLVVVVRYRHEMHELTCKRLHIDNDGNHILKSESTNAAYADLFIGKPDENDGTDQQVEIIGRVLRAVVDYARN